MATKRFGDNPELQDYLGTELIPMQSVEGGTASDSAPVAAGDDVSISLARLRRVTQRSPSSVHAGTSYTLTPDDAFTLVAMSSDEPNTVVVPPASTADFPSDTRIDLSQDGAGQTTIAAGSGVTIRTPETLKLRKQWAKATLIKRDENTWDLEGNLEAAP